MIHVTSGFEVAGWPGWISARERAATGNDRSASGAAVSLTQAARDAAAAAAADARAYAAQLEVAVYDWSFDSSPDPSNDWSS